MSPSTRSAVAGPRAHGRRVFRRLWRPPLRGAARGLCICTARAGPDAARCVWLTPNPSPASSAGLAAQPLWRVCAPVIAGCVRACMCCTYKSRHHAVAAVNCLDSPTQKTAAAPQAAPQLRGPPDPCAAARRSAAARLPTRAGLCQPIRFAAQVAPAGASWLPCQGPAGRPNPVPRQRVPPPPPGHPPALPRPCMHMGRPAPLAHTHPALFAVLCSVCPHIFLCTCRVMPSIPQSAACACSWILVSWVNVKANTNWDKLQGTALVNVSWVSLGYSDSKAQSMYADTMRKASGAGCLHAARS